jgi:hypothetical protein
LSSRSSDGVYTHTHTHNHIALHPRACKHDTKLLQTSSEIQYLEPRFPQKIVAAGVWGALSLAKKIFASNSLSLQSDLYLCLPLLSLPPSLSLCPSLHRQMSNIKKETAIEETAIQRLKSEVNSEVKSALQLPLLKLPVSSATCLI